MSTTHLVLVLDRSGSMSGVIDEVIGGVNQLLKEQRELMANDYVEVTLAIFDTAYDLIWVNTPIEKVEPLTMAIYHPRGMTALNDAIGKTITALDTKLANTTLSKSDGDGGDRVMFVIWTDGKENSSQEWYDTSKVRELIDQRDKAGWNFIYYGAGKEAWQSAYYYTSNVVFTHDNTPQCTTATSGSVSQTLGLYRKSGKAKLSTQDVHDLQADILRKVRKPE